MDNNQYGANYRENETPSTYPEYLDGGLRNDYLPVYRKKEKTVL